MQELSPVVQALEDLRVPRALASLISMVALLVVIYGVTSAYVESMKPYADWLGE